MKIVCEREKILAAFQSAAMVTPTRSPKPILQNVKIEVQDELAVLSATDLEIAIRAEVPLLQAEAPGKAVLPVGRVHAILRDATDEKLLIEADGQGTLIRGEHSEFKLPGENPDEFPPIATFEERDYYELPARFFKEMIRRTVFATDAESSRYALGGVLLEFADDQVTAVGTDGRRLAKMTGPVQAVGSPTVSESTTIVPTRAMQLMERSISDSDAEIQLAVRANDILVRSPRTTIYARLVEGRFPKWREVFPERREGASRIELTAGPMFAALRQASVVASEESRGIDFAFADGMLVLSGNTAEVGQARVELPVAYEGPPLEVMLDHRFVSDFLKVLDAEKPFTLELENAERAALFSTDDGYGYVVMPLSREG